MIHSSKKRIVIVGCGGHARVIADLVKSSPSYELCGFVGNSKQIGTQVDGVPVIADDCSLDSYIDKFHLDGYHIGIGDNFSRQKVGNLYQKNYPSLQLYSVIHPTATVSAHSKLTEGCCIMARAVIQAGTVIKKGVLVNTAAVIEHDSYLEQYSSVATGVLLGGNTHIGERSFVGIGATLVHGISVGKDTVIGAGATVVTDMPNLATCVGTPCRKIKSRKSQDKYL